MIKNKLKELVSELKKFNVQIILVLDYKKINYCKISYSSAKLMASDQTLMKHVKPNGYSENCQSYRKGVCQ